MEMMWIIAVVLGAYLAWNIGANDVANAVGVPVGSGSISLKQAVIIAGIFEFCGAFFLGSNVSQTIASKIIDFSFVHQHREYAYGMIAVLLASGIWLQCASYYGWPVSATHTIIGSVIGCGMFIGGVHSILWKQVISIAMSWILSPLLGGVIAYFLFGLICKTILLKKFPKQVAIYLVPLLTFILLLILSLLLLVNGIDHFKINFSKFELLSTSVVVALIGAVICWKVISNLAAQQQQEETAFVEKVFGYLQIIIACVMSIAHGSNDVANAIAPVAVIVQILSRHTLVDTFIIPSWLLFLGASCIVLGLATWGWRVIDTVGKKITELTPSRGFAVGLSAAITIIGSSQLGLPLSTTHVVVGSILGVGYARGWKALNLRVLRDIFISWVITLPAGASLAILFFYMIKYLLH